MEIVIYLKRKMIPTWMRMGDSLQLMAISTGKLQDICCSEGYPADKPKWGLFSKQLLFWQDI